MMFFSPYVIEPLFNKFEPVTEEGLEADIRVMMEKAGLKVGRVMRMDASRRSKHSNAYFTGIGKVKRIVLFDTLIKQMTHAEIVAVLAHEIGHWKKGHIWKRLIMAELMALAGVMDRLPRPELAGPAGADRTPAGSFASGQDDCPGIHRIAGDVSADAAIGLVFPPPRAGGGLFRLQILPAIRRIWPRPWSNSRPKTWPISSRTHFTPPFTIPILRLSSGCGLCVNGP